MCSTPRSSSSTRRQSTGYRSSFPVNHGYWNKMVAEKDKQLAERARLEELEALEAEEMNEPDFELMVTETKAEPSHNSKLSRLFGYIQQMMP